MKQSVLILLALLCQSFSFLPSAAFGAELSWSLYSSATCASSATSFSCGDRGHYSIGAEGPKKWSKAACSPSAGGSEAPPVYAGTALPPAGPTPCDDGSCLGNVGSTPWVAVIDWGQEWHGEAVSWMIDEIAGPDVDVVLFPLDGSPVAALSPGATDLQVLEQLCAVLDEVDADRAPVAVNMSFGRPPSPATLCEFNPTLACEISAVLEDIADDGVWLVAAAGNHQTPLFPGTHPDVMSVGSLDIETFRGGAQVAPAWQSPVADALMPAAALCLNHGAGAWGPPPGSSFAAAFMTSWLAASRLPFEDPAIGGWAPIRQIFSAGPEYLLGNALGQFPTTSVSSIDDLLDAVRLGDVGGCHPLNFFTEPVVVSVVPRSSAPDAAPIVNYRPSTNGPTPDPDPCLPCTGGWDDGPGGGGLTAPDSAEPVYKSSVQQFAVSFMDSPGVPEELELVDVMLVRSRGDLYLEIDLPSAQHAALIADIASGVVTSLSFEGLDQHLASGDSVSVVYIFQPSESEASLLLEKGLGATNNRYWSSTPVYALDIQWPDTPQ